MKPKIPAIYLMTLMTITGCQTLSLRSPSLTQPQFPIPSPIPQAYNTQELVDKTSIMQVQRLLTNASFHPGPIDGDAGKKYSNTRKAIRAYQKANHLPVDGKVSIGLLQHLSGDRSHRAEPTIRPFKPALHRNGGHITSAGCAKTGYQPVDMLAAETVRQIFANLQLDIDPYITGLCAPADKESLTNLYLFLVSEGAIHSRLASAQYYDLLVAYEQAGIDTAIRKEDVRNDNESLLSDIRTAAGDPVDGAKDLLEHGFVPEDNEAFQAKLIDAYNRIEDSSEHKYRVKAILSNVLAHSTASTFYLARSAMVLSKLVDHFGRNLNPGTVFSDIRLGFVLASQQPSLISMLTASTYTIRSWNKPDVEITQQPSKDIEEEVRQTKIAGGYPLQKLDSEYFIDNKPTDVM